jgi:hypothetical protein
MKKEFVTYEQSIDLRDLGFDEPCLGYWKSKNWLIQEKTRTDGYTHADQECSAPLYQQAFRWFREKYKLYSHVRESYSFDNTLEFVTQINGSYVNHGIFDKPVNRFETHEEAEQACLDKLIEIVKNK